MAHVFGIPASVAKSMSDSIQEGSLLHMKSDRVISLCLSQIENVIYYEANNGRTDAIVRFPSVSYAIQEEIRNSLLSAEYACNTAREGTDTKFMISW